MLIGHGVTNMGYVEDQAKWLKQTGLQQGDRVAIVAVATAGQSGWSNDWAKEYMKVPDEGEYMGDAGGAGLDVRTKQGRYRYPFWVLIKL